MLQRIYAVLVTASLVGCASTPDVTFSYYPAKASVLVTVTQTLDCNAAKTKIVDVNSAAFSTVYMADTEQKPHKLRIKELNGAFADNDFAITWFDDGRLKSINQSSTGQGETILKAAITFAKALPIGGGDSGKADVTRACNDIAIWGSNKPVTIVYTGLFDLAAGKPSDTKPLTATQATGALYEKIRSQLPLLQAEVVTPQSSALLTRTKFASDDVRLKLNQTVMSTVSALRSGQIISQAAVVTPTRKTYEIPIPKAAVFGKQTFALNLSDAGTVSSLTYNKTAGAAGALNVLNAVEAATASKTDAAQLAETKNAADLIFQQQRLTRCQAQPDKCQ